MVQPRLAYAGVVELPQEVCRLPWQDEETLKQDDKACDPPVVEEEEENIEEEQSVSAAAPISAGEDDASHMNRDNDVNTGVEVKPTSRFDLGLEIAICFFHTEAKDPENMDPEYNQEQRGTELAEHALGIKADETSLSTLAMHHQGETVQQGNTFKYVYLLQGIKYF